MGLWLDAPNIRIARYLLPKGMKPHSDILKSIRLKLSRKTAYKDVLEAVNGIPLKN